MIRKKPYCPPQIVSVCTDTFQLMSVSINQEGDVESVDIGDEDYDEDKFEIL